MPAKVLVIDDELTMERLIKKVLRAEIAEDTYTIEFIDNADDAYTYLCKNGYGVDVILSDINMPGKMDGLSLLAEVGKMDILAKTIIISAYGDMEKARQAIQSGAFDFIEKPFDIDDLKFSVKRAVEYTLEQKRNSALEQKQKTLELLVEETELKFKVITDSAYDAIFMLDQWDRITYLNKSAEEMFGFSLDEMVDQEKKITDLVIPGDAEGVSSNNGQNVREGTYEFTGVTRMGNLFPMEISFSAVKHKEEIYRICIIRDLTARKKMESFKQSAAVADAKNLAKTQFLAQMSHEIRTPMNAIIGMAELLANTDLDKEQKEYCRNVIFSADFLLNIINEILDFSKIEAGKMELFNRDTNLYEVADGICEIVSPLASKKGLELICSIGAGVPGTIVADTERLKQIFLNLLSNAIKFTDQGEVFFSISVREKKAGRVLLEISVADTGIGIAPDDLEKLFKVFSQVNTEKTRERHGSGLGLAISKRLVDAMGGDISVVSFPDEGTTFRLTLEFPEGPDHDLFDHIRLAPLSLLVGERNQKMIDVLKSYFSEWGVEADFVSSSEALEKSLPEKKYNLILLGNIGISCRETGSLVDKLKALQPVAAGCIAFAGLSREEKEGLDFILTRPVKKLRLLEVLAHCCPTPPEGLLQKISSFYEVERFADAVLPVSAENRHILVVEDSMINRKLLKKIIADAGFSVEEAENGRMGVDMALSKNYDLIFMDVQMPLLNGMEAAAEIRAGHVTTPIIAVTANAFWEQQQECLAAGMTECMTKPYKQKDVFRMIKKYLGGE